MPSCTHCMWMYMHTCAQYIHVNKTIFMYMQTAPTYVYVCLRVYIYVCVYTYEPISLQLPSCLLIHILAIYLHNMHLRRKNAQTITSPLENCAPRAAPGVATCRQDIPAQEKLRSHSGQPTCRLVSRAPGKSQKRTPPQFWTLILL